MFRYTKYVMYVAPFGVGAAIAVTIGSKGIGVLFGLGKLVGTLYLAQALFVILVLGSSLLINGRSDSAILAGCTPTFPDRVFYRVKRGCITSCA